MAKTTKSKNKKSNPVEQAAEQAYETVFKVGLREGLDENLLDNLLRSRRASEEWLACHLWASQEFNTALDQWHLFNEMIDEMSTDNEDPELEARNQNAQNTGQRTKARPISMGARSFDITAFAAARAKIQEWETQLEAVA